MRLKKNIAISDSGFLLNPSTGESFSINPMGVIILKLLNEDTEYSEIENKLISEYDVAKSTLDKDIQDFVGLMNSYGLIEMEKPSVNGR